MNGFNLIGIVSLCTRSRRQRFRKNFCCAGVLGVVIALFTGNVLAAEIINVNYKYKIAFADLTQSDVQTGDTVTVRTANGKQIRLKVIETYPVMIKLTVFGKSDASGEASEAEDFSAITVGSQVEALRPQTAESAKVKPAVNERSGVRQTERSGVPVEVGKSRAEMNVSAAQDTVPANVEVFVPRMPARAATPAAPARDSATVRPVAATVKPAVVTVTPEPRDGAPLPMLSMVPRESTANGDTESRIDKLTTANLKLAENVSTLLAEKKDMESRYETRIKESTLALESARNQIRDVGTGVRELEAKFQDLESRNESCLKDRNRQQSTIADLELKLTELKKKLARMADIVNINLKAYEKQ